MDNQPLVSVVIATYNRQKYIARAIESVGAQTYANMEIIVVNDASTDNTAEVLAALAAQYPRLTVITNERNLKLVASLNKGIAASQGKYIGRLDDEDFWCDTQKIQKQVEFLQQHPDHVLVGGGAIKIDENGKEVSRYLLPQNDQDIRKVLLAYNPFVHVSVLFYKDIFLKAGGYDQAFDGLEDWEAWLRLGTFGKLHNIPEFFVTYIGHSLKNAGYVANTFKRSRQRKVTVSLAKKYRSQYPGFGKAIFFAWATYGYSFLPFRHVLAPAAYRIKTMALALITPGQSLSKRTARGTAWLFSFRIVDQSMGLIRTIVLARLLEPSDFGLFGITVLAVSLLDTFSQSGFAHALIQKKDDIKPYLNTGWMVQVGRGLLLAAILFFTAPLIAVFFKSPQAQPILQWVSLAIVIQGLTNIAVVYFSKELEFHKYFFYQLSGTAANLVVSITLAVLFHSVWALVAGLLTEAVVRCIASYIIHPYLPRLEFNFARAKELFGFGKWIFSSSVIGFFITQVDSLMVGRLAGVASLGFYQVAYKIPSVLGSDVLTGAIFPAYAKIQHDTAKIKEAYYKTVQLFSFVLVPMAGGICIVAPEFIRLFLGEKWLPSLWPMRFLTLSVLVWSVEVVSNHLFLALGKPHIETKWNTVRFAVIITLLYPFIVWWGIAGAGLAVFLSSLVGATGFAVEAVSTLRGGAGGLVKNIAVPSFNTLLMVAGVGALKNIFPSGLLGFFMLIAAGALAYCLFSYAADMVLGQKTIPLFKKTLLLLIQ